MSKTREHGATRGNTGQNGATSLASDGGGARRFRFISVFPRLPASSRVLPRSPRRTRGFTLIEILVVVAIIAVLSSIVIVATGGARQKARDAKRKSDLSQVGRMLQTGCYMPDVGAGEHDMSVIVTELKLKYPQYAAAISKTPKDPKTGTDEDTGYAYIITADGKKCAFYANLEYEGEKVTLTSLTAPTPGGGSGVLNAPGAPGVNGTTLYFQVSN